MYTVHMSKRVTATEARRNWFRLLDEVAAGEDVVIERHGWRIRLSREEGGTGARPVPDYSELIQARDVDGAEAWRWSWDGPEADLRLDGEGPGAEDG